MINNNRVAICPALFVALVLGIGAVLLLLNVTLIIFPIILWIALGFAVIILIVVVVILTMPTSGNSAVIIRSLVREGNFLIISILGTILTAAVALAIQALLVAGTTSIAVIALVFLFGFFFGGLLASVYFFLSCVFSRLATGSNCTNTTTIRVN